MQRPAFRAGRCCFWRAYTIPSALKSPADRVLRLPGDTVLLSGHSAQTTVDAEKQRQR